VLIPYVFIPEVTNRNGSRGETGYRCPPEARRVRGKGDGDVTFTSPPNHFVAAIQEPPKHNLFTQNWGQIHLATFGSLCYRRRHFPYVEFSRRKGQPEGNTFPH